MNMTVILKDNAPTYRGSIVSFRSYFPARLAGRDVLLHTYQRRADGRYDLSAIDTSKNEWCNVIVSGTKLDALLGGAS